MNQLTPNGISWNGVRLNGISWNGVQLNGTSLNGMSLNGISWNGISWNGISWNGISWNGVQLNGISWNGISWNGMALNGISWNGISWNGISWNGISWNGVSLGARRLNGLALNGVELSKVSLGGQSLNGIRLNGARLDNINLSTAKLGGATLTSAQMSHFKRALSYVAKCALPSGQCVTVTDTNGTSTYSLCGVSGLDPVWNTDPSASISNEPAVTQCVIDAASSDPAHPENEVSHTNLEALSMKDFYTHAVSCALPQGTCVTSTDFDGSTFQACGSEGLDPAWQNGAPTPGAVAEQVAACVADQASSHGDAWVDLRAQLKTVLKYAAECALRPDQSVTITDWDGSSLTWQGALGLADWWNAAPLSPAPAGKPAAAGEELVSACLMARSNASGKSVSLSVRARPELAPSGDEATKYARHEGAFMGNLFSATPVAKTCSGPGGNGWLRDPVTGEAMSAGRQCAAGTDCGFEYVGACTAVCTVKPGVNGEALFDDCAGNANVINTFLYSVDDYAADAAAQTTEQIAPSGSGAAMAATADFNGDGHTDLAIEDNASSLIVRLGDGHGGFAADATLALGASVTVRAVIAKDVDDDGDVDLVTANDDSLSVLLGNGDGTFAAPAHLPVANAAGVAAAVTAGDFNHDGAIDLAANLTTGIGVFLGVGDGTFGTQSTQGGSSNHHLLTAGDFNGDGNIDLARAFANGTTINVAWGDGAGNFGPATNTSIGAGADRVRAMTAGDWNGDGRTDLALAISGANTVRVMLGQPNGTFAATSYAISGSGDMAFVGAAYLDNGDASRELIVARGGTISILTGAANGTFSLATSFTVSGTARHVVAGHFDGDALWRADLLVSTDAGSLVLVPGA